MNRSFSDARSIPVRLSALCPCVSTHSVTGNGMLRRACPSAGAKSVVRAQHPVTRSPVSPSLLVPGAPIHIRERMQPYQGADGTSGIDAYETGEDFIRVRFRDGTVYVYTHESTGQEAVDRMKALASDGRGLNTFINTNVRTRYAWQEPIDWGSTTGGEPPVVYEVIAVVRDDVREAYERYMRERHVPDLLDTGAFVDASIAVASPGRYRIAYTAAGRAALDAYLRDHAARLRAHFLEEFPEGVDVSREEWTVLERWQVRAGTPDGDGDGDGDGNRDRDGRGAHSIAAGG